MHAKVGDYLVVKGTTTERHDQHAEIIEVRSADGSPPYVVRWLVNGHETTVYPGSDAVVVTATEHAEAGARCRAGRARGDIAGEKLCWRCGAYRSHVSSRSTRVALRHSQSSRTSRGTGSARISSHNCR